MQEDRGGYSSASSGAFQEECKGPWGWGQGPEPECPSLCCLPPTPTRPGCIELAKALPYTATEESGLSRLFVFDFWGLPRGNSTPPLKSEVWGKAEAGLSPPCAPVRLPAATACPSWHSVGHPLPQGERKGPRQGEGAEGTAARAAVGRGPGGARSASFGGGRCGPRREEPREVGESSGALRLLEVGGSFLFWVPGVFSPVTGKQHTSWGSGSTGDSPQEPFCPLPSPVGIWQRPEAFWSLQPQAGTGIQE